MPTRCPRFPFPRLPVAAALVLFLATSVPARAGTAPNIVLIVADDLGYADLGCYGQKLIPTPNLDRLAREGMRFTQFYAGSTVCAPSRNVLMTGQHTGHALIRGNAKLALRPEDVTVAEVLQQSGYQTYLAGKWGLGGEGTTGTPLRQGFDRFYGYLDQAHAHNYYPTFLIHDDRRVPLPNIVPDEGPHGQGVASVRKAYSADLIALQAQDYLAQTAGVRAPFFLYFAPTLPHANNEARGAGMEVPDYGEFATKDWPDAEKGFAAMVARLDRQVGDLLRSIEGRDTLVLFTSDNGPHREGGHDPDFFDSNGPLRGYKRGLSEGGIRVPLIAWRPGKIPAGRATDAVAYHGDILATLAEIAGAPVPAGVDSVSFLRVLRGEEATPRGPLYWEFYEGASAQAVRDGRWKAIRSPMFSGPVELYDVDADPAEQRNLAAENPEIVARMTGFMEASHTVSPHWRVHR